MISSDGELQVTSASCQLESRLRPVPKSTASLVLLRPCITIFAYLPTTVVGQRAVDAMLSDCGAVDNSLADRRELLTKEKISLHRPDVLSIR